MTLNSPHMGLGQFTGGICLMPYPAGSGAMVPCPETPGAAGGGGTGVPSGPVSGQGSVTGFLPSSGLVIPYPGDICTSIVQKLLGNTATSQAIQNSICQGNFNFCSFLCSLFGMDASSSGQCVQVLCPLTFLAGAGILVYVTYKVVKAVI